MPDDMPELAQTREMLDRRYDELKSGKVRPIAGDEALARLKANTEAERNRVRSIRR